jgi:hypothetical protein
MATSADIQAIVRFQTELISTLFVAVRALGNELGGKFSDETLAAIHAQFPALQQAALDAPGSALVGFDLLLAMFPPPSG